MTAPAPESTAAVIKESIAYCCDLAKRSKEWEAVRKMLQRDIVDLRTLWGIEVEFDESEHHYRLAAAIHPHLNAPRGKSFRDGAVSVRTRWY